MSRRKAEQLELTPLATVTGYCATGVAPAMLVCSIPTVQKLWKMNNREGENDYDLYNIMRHLLQLV